MRAGQSFREYDALVIDYLKTLAKSGTYADSIVLQICSDILKCKVVVLVPHPPTVEQVLVKQDTPVLWGFQMFSPDQTPFSQDRMSLEEVIAEAETANFTKHILLVLDHKHYDLLLPQGHANMRLHGRCGRPRDARGALRGIQELLLLEVTTEAFPASDEEQPDRPQA